MGKAVQASISVLKARNRADDESPLCPVIAAGGQNVEVRTVSTAVGCTEESPAMGIIITNTSTHRGIHVKTVPYSPRTKTSSSAANRSIDAHGGTRRIYPLDLPNGFCMPHVV